MRLTRRGLIKGLLALPIVGVFGHEVAQQAVTAKDTSASRDVDLSPAAPSPAVYRYTDGRLEPYDVFIEWGSNEDGSKWEAWQVRDA